MVKAWRITWGERSWTVDDSMARHEALVVMGYGSDSFEVFDISGPVRLRAWLAAFLTVADERDYVEVLAELAAIPTPTILDALTYETG